MRRLQAIEITEGALLADIAVIFQLLVRYLPVGGGIFRMLSIVVFAILVLRRGLYAGIMGGFVAMFICVVVTGPLSAISMSLIVGAGVFLGMAMRLRTRHLPTLLLGATCGSLALYGFLMCLSFFFGINILRNMQQTYTFIIGIVNVVATAIGLGGWWQHSLYPLVAAVIAWAFGYWWAFLYVVLWIGLVPALIVIYLVTNALVRLLGYDVVPFPGGRIERWRQRVMRRLVRLSIKRGWLGRNAGRA